MASRCEWPVPEQHSVSCSGTDDLKGTSLHNILDGGDLYRLVMIFYERSGKKASEILREDLPGVELESKSFRHLVHR